MTRRQKLSATLNLGMFIGGYAWGTEFGISWEGLLMWLLSGMVFGTYEGRVIDAICRLADRRNRKQTP